MGTKLKELFLYLILFMWNEINNATTYWRNKKKKDWFQLLVSLFIHIRIQVQADRKSKLLTKKKQTQNFTINIFIFGHDRKHQVVLTKKVHKKSRIDDS